MSDTQPVAAVIELAWKEVGRNDVIKTAAVTVDGFDCAVTVSYDWDADTSHYGVFVNKWRPGALKYPPAKRDHTLCDYFVPEYTLAERIKDELVAGATAQEARRTALDGLKRAMLIVAGSDMSPVSFVSVTVTASLAGTDLGDAALYNIEIESDDDDYLDTVASDLIHEAIGNARDNLKATMAAAQKIGL